MYSASPSPPLRLDVVHMRVLPCLDRRHDLADVHAVFDHGVAELQVLERDLVAERNILDASERDLAVLVEDQPGERLSGLNAFDDDHRDRILGVVQYAMNHGERMEPGEVMRD